MGLVPLVCFYGPWMREAYMSGPAPTRQRTDSDPPSLKVQSHPKREYSERARSKKKAPSRIRFFRLLRSPSVPTTLRLASWPTPISDAPPTPLRRSGRRREERGAGRRRKDKGPCVEGGMSTSSKKMRTGSTSPAPMRTLGRQ
jgi:hypothetical protein